MIEAVKNRYWHRVRPHLPSLFPYHTVNICFFRYFVSFYYFQRGEGIEFPDSDESESGSKKKKPETTSKDPNVVSSQQEADDIAKG